MVAKRLGVDLADMQSKSRKSAHINARHAVVLLLRGIGLDYSAIGREIRRDRATAKSALNRALVLYDYDADFRAAVDDVRADLERIGWRTIGVK